MCKYKHKDKLTSQPYTDNCNSCSGQTTTFRCLNILAYCTFLQFHPTLRHPDLERLTSSTTLWMSWKVHEETWTMLWETKANPKRDAKISVPAVTRSPAANLCLSFDDKTIPPVPVVCNTSVT
jgi:hypothetical protein